MTIELNDGNTNSKLLQDYSFILMYQGEFGQSPSVSLANLAENHLSKVYRKKIVRKLVYLLVEMVQNIERYSAHIDPQVDQFIMYADEKQLVVLTQNLVPNDAVEGLKGRLGELKDLAKQELDEIYREVLSSEIRTEKGAGLGLIDIARRTGNNLTSHFVKYNDSYTIVQFRTTYPVSEDVVADKVEDELFPPIFSQISEGNKSTFFYSGDFSNDFLVSLIEMLNSVKTDDSVSQDSLFRHGLIELVQNIRRHGSVIDESKKGFISINWRENNVMVSSCNVIDEAKEAKINEYISKLNQSSLEELEKMKEDMLNDFSIEGGLGFIQISTFIRPNEIVFNFLPYQTQHKLLEIRTSYKN